MIKASDLYKTYSGGIHALNGVSFEVNPGEICGYIGTNGAGKSTTLKILCGMLNFDKGSVSIGDSKLPGNEEKIKSIIGYVPESAEMFNSLTVKEYFEFIRDVRNIDSSSGLRRANYFAELFSFTQHLGDSIGKLSKGNRQKVLITSALLHNPDILLFDEPLNGLDAFSIMIFQDMVVKLAAKGKTVFYSSHLLDLMEKVSSRIIVIDKGKILIDKPKSELNNSEEYKSLESFFREIAVRDKIKEFAYDEAFS
ncbi:MAG: ABC transporter ATP-binding protein [Bacteroidetes bacterium]|nr:ABC transporter ATP-binding protein [Bacteroidota bacterium]